MALSDLDSEFDGTVAELVFQDRMSLAARFQTAFFHAVFLKQPIEVRWLTPAAFKVVKSNLPLIDVEDDGIPPVGETNRVAGGFPAKQRDGLVNGLSQFESTAGQAQRFGIANLCLDGDNM
jgi:hypothetical protein